MFVLNKDSELWVGLDEIPRFSDNLVDNVEKFKELIDRGIMIIKEK